MLDGPVHVKIVFLVCEDWKKLFFRCIYILDLVLKCCSDETESNGIQLLLIHCSAKQSHKNCWNKFFFVCRSGFGLKFCRTAVLRKRLHMDSKTDLTTKGLFLEFVLQMASVWRLHICMDVDELVRLKCFSLLAVSNLFHSLSAEHFGLFLEGACMFRHPFS